MDSPARNNGGRGPIDFTQLTSYHLDTLDIARGMSVEALNGRVGVVDEIVFDASSGRTTHFLVRKGNGLTRDALIPVEWICQLGEGRILLAVRVEQVDAYADRPPEYSKFRDGSPAT